MTVYHTQRLVISSLRNLKCLCTLNSVFKTLWVLWIKNASMQQFIGRTHTLTQMRERIMLAENLYLHCMSILIVVSVSKPMVCWYNIICHS